MNPTLTISLLYGLLTLGTASILYFSFKGKIDYSGRFFLLAELLMLPTVGYLTLISLQPSYKVPWVSFLGNLCYTSSEISILFSIYALTHNVSIRKYLMAIVGVGIYCALMEYARTQDPAFPFLLLPLAYLVISLGTYTLCLRATDSSLKSNLFLRWFKYLEVAIASVALLRIMLYFLGIILLPSGSNYLAVILYVSYITINLFRFISYQSLRITWVPNANDVNLLNSSLARSTQEKNQLVNELIRSNRMLGMSALAGSLAHQLSQPLTGAALETESIKRNLARRGHEQGTTESLNKVSSQLNKLSELVRNLRKLFGAKEAPFETFSLIEVCDNILALTEPTTTAHKITVYADYRANPTVCGDAIQIQQVLINLLNNAIEAVIAGGRNEKLITLRIDQNECYALLTAADNGAGIASDMRSSMFELYKTTKQSGMGIGLWLSHTIVTRHNGKITADNQPDGGAIFTVQLPLVNAKQ